MPNVTRNKKFLLNFCTSYDIVSGWDTLTDTATIVIPKKMLVKDGAPTTPSASFKWYNVITNIGAGDDPLFMRGDQISITAGYRYFDNNGQEITTYTLLFQGYITNVDSKMDITLRCEDNMWKLKQIPTAGKQWALKSGKYTVESMMRELLANNPEYSVNNTAHTTVDFSSGCFVTQNESVAQVLSRIRNELHLVSYFRDNELRIGFPVYIEDEANNLMFEFQQNIIEDDLEYRSKEDITLSAIVHSLYDEVHGTTKDGQPKTKRKRMDVLVYQDISGGDFKYMVKTNGQPFPNNLCGERRTIFYPGKSTNAADLAAYGMQELQRYYYTGFHGSFTTFGIPYVKFGDNVQLVDSLLPDRNGTYKVKKVEYSGGVNGLRQKVFLDYKINT